MVHNAYNGKEKAATATRAFWLPFAYRDSGNYSEDELRELTQQSIWRLEEQIQHLRLNKSDNQEGATSAATPASGSTPRSPETEKGRQVRDQYLTYAQMVLRDTRLTYPDLYQRYASDRSQAQQSAQALDQAIATLALKSGPHPRQVIQLLAQGPFTQHQTQNLSLEEKRLAIPKLLHYAQSTVETIQRQQFVEYANAVTGKSWSYSDLYREHIGSDLTAIQLDQKVTAAALQAGEPPDAIAALLQQGPYARFQQDVKQVSADTIEQYARGTIAQVQEIQSLSLIRRNIEAILTTSSKISIFPV